MATAEENDRKRIAKGKCSVCDKYITWDKNMDHPETCPHCKTYKWYRPKHDAKLFTLQKLYFEHNRDHKYLAKMYDILVDYAKNAIYNRTKNKYRMNDEKVMTKAHDSATVLITYYLEKPEFKVNKTFSSYVLGAVNYQLYYRKFQKIDKLEISSETPMFTSESGSVVTLGDQLSSVPNTEKTHYNEYMESKSKKFTLDVVSDFITEAFDVIKEEKGLRNSVNSFLLLHHFLSGKNQTFFNRYYSHFGGKTQEYYEKLKFILYEFIEQEVIPNL